MLSLITKNDPDHVIKSHKTSLDDEYYYDVTIYFEKCDFAKILQILSHCGEGKNNSLRKEIIVDYENKSGTVIWHFKIYDSYVE